MLSIFQDKRFWIGVACGVAGIALVKTSTFRKGCAKVIAGGLKLKEDASEFLETVKEDVEDEKAASSAKKA